MKNIKYVLTDVSHICQRRRDVSIISQYY
eukprot:SAG11_NODE_21731_length_419_cov_2.596875_1_plen_28_part_10